MLEGLAFLHDKGIVHGKLTCESIYINSNNGEIKIGDIGIKHIYALSQQACNQAAAARSELGQSKWYLKEQNTTNFDVFCFGLALLEIISAEIVGPHTFRFLNRILNKGGKMKVINSIEDPLLRDFLSKALEENPEKRAAITQLVDHEFF